MQLHCVVDNLSAHFTPKVEAFLDDHPRIFLHNTPTHALLAQPGGTVLLDPGAPPTPQRRVRQRGALAERIIAFINDNRRAKPFSWTYDGRPLKVA